MSMTMTTSWHSYPKIWALGHKAIDELLLDPVIVEEKIDGSQFSFGIFDGELKARSKGRGLLLDAPEKMFKSAIETIKELKPLLKEGWTYRGEFLQKPKHNALAYDRIPNKHIIIFDINTGEEAYLDYALKAEEAKRLGLEVVPIIHEGKMSSIDFFKDILDRTSILGGQKIEGIVIKNYKRFGADKKVLMGKFVSEKYKEVQKASWKESNPTKGDVIQNLIITYRTQARWEKAIIHLKEAGILENSLRDIGGLIKEVQNDVKTECKEEIMKVLFDYVWPQMQRGIISGLPEWYKQKLAEKQFNREDRE